MKVRNMQSPRGNDVPNQFIISNCVYETGKLYCKGDIFQSYDSAIAFKSYDSGKVYLDEKYWDYSRTTGKYRNIFLGETKAETQAKIDNGTYKLVNLN